MEEDRFINAFDEEIMEKNIHQYITEYVCLLFARRYINNNSSCIQFIRLFVKYYKNNKDVEEMFNTVKNIRVSIGMQVGYGPYLLESYRHVQLPW